MKAIVMCGPGKENIRIKDIEEPTPKEDEVKIKVHATGICGSELHLYKNEILNYPITYPRILGHEYSGVICEVGPKVRKLSVGDRVTATVFAPCFQCHYCRKGFTNLCLNQNRIAFAFTNYTKVKEKFVYELPKNIDLDAGALIENLACVVHAVLENASLFAGEVAVVIGPGPIGLLTCQVVMAQGVKVILVGRKTSQKRLEVAKRIGVDHIINSDEQDSKDVIFDLTKGLGTDVCFDCAGTASAVNLALDVVRKKGTYIELSLFGSRVEIDIEKVMLKEISVVGAMGYRMSSWKRVFTLFEKGKMNPEVIKLVITSRMSMWDWEKGFRNMAEKNDVKVLLYPFE